MIFRKAKEEHWDSIKDKYSEILNVDGVDVEKKGFDNYDKFYHIIFRLEKDIFIHTQCDIESSGSLYAFSIKIGEGQLPSFEVRLDISEEQATNIIKNWHKYSELKEMLLKIRELPEMVKEQK